MLEIRSAHLSGNPEKYNCFLYFIIRDNKYSTAVSLFTHHNKTRDIEYSTFHL